MKKVLLLGAGFSRNWGGWLASEAFEYLLGCPQVMANDHVRELLWKHKDGGGFEAALADVQLAWKRDPRANQASLESLQTAIGQMFEDMNTAFMQHGSLEFQQMQEFSVTSALAQFDAIFTLNQDLLMEHRYLNENVSLMSRGRWDGYQLPGIELTRSTIFPDVPSFARHDGIPMKSDGFRLDERAQPFIKLHGSSNWTDPVFGPLLVMGGNKLSEIKFHPILIWYQELFEHYLSETDSRLMVIGYGFRDQHINETVDAAVHKAGLKMFIIDPAGADLAWRANPTRAPGAIAQATPLEEMFKASVIGASRRNLREIFGGDSVEHGKVMRFLSA